MAITRSQIARQLMQEGGVPRQGYFLGKLVRKIKDDIIPNELKSPAGVAAALTAANFAPKFIPGGSDKTLLQQFLPSVSGALKTARESTGKVLFGDKDDDDSRGIFGTVTDAITKPRFPAKDSKDKISIGDRLLSGIFGPAGLAIGSGLLAGAFTKDKEDPLYTGQDVGLNLQDIGKLANITDPRVGQAIGLRFLPDVEARKFTPAQMAETFAANEPVEFTEKREQAQDGGMIGDQKDFEEFLRDMENRDKSMLHDRIMEDFEKFMKRKRMMENLPEAKDGGIMKARPKKISMEAGQESTLEEIYFDLIAKGMNPAEAAKKATEIYMNMSDGMANGGPIDPGYLGIPPVGLGTGARPGGVPLPSLGDYDDSRGVMKGMRKKNKKGKKKKRDKKAEGGMMDMGGMEMDLRGGGFVPMGRAEKADDVPARLSKNEFVFTADAVRAAGGGDVDKGADKMYATMKKLEDRVA